MKLPLALIFLVFFVTACGGGGGDSDDDLNDSDEVISAEDEIEVADFTGLETTGTVDFFIELRMDYDDLLGIIATDYAAFVFFGSTAKDALNTEAVVDRVVMVLPDGREGEFTLEGSRVTDFQWLYEYVGARSYVGSNTSSRSVDEESIEISEASIAYIKPVMIAAMDSLINGIDTLLGHTVPSANFAAAVFQKELSKHTSDQNYKTFAGKVLVRAVNKIATKFANWFRDLSGKKRYQNASDLLDDAEDEFVELEHDNYIVQSPQGETLVHAEVAPTASFSYELESAYAPSKVYLDGKASRAADGGWVELYWEIMHESYAGPITQGGDSNTAGTSFDLGNPGKYSVSLIATSQNGYSAKLTKYFTILGQEVGPAITHPFDGTWSGTIASYQCPYDTFPTRTDPFTVSASRFQLFQSQAHTLGVIDSVTGVASFTTGEPNSGEHNSAVFNSDGTATGEYAVGCYVNGEYLSSLKATWTAVKTQ